MPLMEIMSLMEIIMLISLMEIMSLMEMMSLMEIMFAYSLNLLSLYANITIHIQAACGGITAKILQL